MSGSRRRGLAHRSVGIVAGLRDASRRNISFSAVAIPGHLAMAGWKSALMIVSPSLFLLANVVFTLGLAAAKALVIVADRRAGRHGDTAAPLRVYRATGWLVFILATGYIAACVPFFLGQHAHASYEQPVAIAIATVTFAELGFSVHGLFSSRRRGDLLMEAVKLSNLAAALLLLVLTQTALLALSHEDDAMVSLSNGISGVVFGAGAAVIGLSMVLRPRRKLALALIPTSDDPIGPNDVEASAPASVTTPVMATEYDMAPDLPVEGHAQR